MNRIQIADRLRIIAAVEEAGELTARRAAYLANCSINVVMALVKEQRLKIVRREAKVKARAGSFMAPVRLGHPIVAVIR